MHVAWAKYVYKCIDPLSERLRFGPILGLQRANRAPKGIHMHWKTLAGSAILSAAVVALIFRVKTLRNNIAGVA